METVALGLALPLTGYWFYDAMREKSVKLLVLTGLAFVGSLVGFLWVITHISV